MWRAAPLRLRARRARALMLCALACMADPPGSDSGPRLGPISDSRRPLSLLCILHAHKHARLTLQLGFTLTGTGTVPVPVTVIELGCWSGPGGDYTQSRWPMEVTINCESS